MRPVPTTDGVATRIEPRQRTGNRRRGRRRWRAERGGARTARECALGSDAEALVDACALDAAIQRAAIPVVALGVGLTHLTGQRGARRRGWRTTRRAELVRQRAGLTG